MRRKNCGSVEVARSRSLCYICAAMQIREPVVANQFYPGDPARLKQDVLRYISGAEFSKEVSAVLGGGEGKKGGHIKAVIVPHAGYIYSGPVAGYGYKALKALPRDVEWKVLLLGPSHFVPFNGASVFPDGVWKTPLGSVAVKDIRREIGGGAGSGSGGGAGGKPGGGAEVDEDDDEVFLNIPEAHSEEHSLEVQVPFLQICLEKFVLYPIACGGVRPDFLAEKLAEFVARDDVIVVVSSDLSHYLPYDKAVVVDRATLDGITKMDIERVIERGDACGIKGILSLMFLAERFGWKPVLLDYKNSGDTAGDKSAVVGYGSVGWMASGHRLANK